MQAALTHDKLSRVNQLDSLVAVAAPTASPQLGLDLIGLAHKNHADAEVARRSKRAINLYVGRVVTSHSVENDLTRQL